MENIHLTKHNPPPLVHEVPTAALSQKAGSKIWSEVNVALDFFRSNNEGVLVIREWVVQYIVEVLKYSGLSHTTHSPDTEHSLITASEKAESHVDFRPRVVVSTFCIESGGLVFYELDIVKSFAARSPPLAFTSLSLKLSSD
ncbi:uncharacterized protein A4U43_C10F2700 [Asparagus officinalis]|uniref:Uncharacterized protein n=1 Tax=Asparagus officinalis TaxID=4686 RepID=A0A5P1E0M8_ASPOF|nr:uncharacterized protein A4U43_C10F2700 [Asparagus officinalis]